MLRNFFHRALLCLNVVAIILLLAVGYSGSIKPVNHSLWALMGFAFPAVLVLNIAFLIFWFFDRWRYAIVPVIGLLMAYGPIRTYMPLNSQDEHPHDAIKVVTYNVLGFNLSQAPQGEPNPILKYVIDSKADIVCMQEFSCCCQNDTLWPDCEKQYPYRDTLMSRGGANGDCIALFSRYPIVSKEPVMIKTKGNTAGVFTVDVDGYHVCVINVHLETVGMSEAEKSHFSEMVHGKAERDSMEHDSWNIITKLTQSSMIRAPQADLIHDVIRHRLGDMRSLDDREQIDGGIILCGDFNDHPLSYVHHTIADELTDCYVETGCGPGFTMHYNSMYFRIDNILCSSNWQPYQCTVDKSISLSDHYPVYCYLKRKNKR